MVYLELTSLLLAPGLFKRLATVFSFFEVLSLDILIQPHRAIVRATAERGLDHDRMGLTVSIV